MSTSLDELIGLENFIGEYPLREDPKLQYGLFKKKEFHDLKLERFEPRPTQGGNFNQQLIIERFLSDKTLYDVLLLIHGLGTGKTRTSILVAEINRIRNAKDGKDRRPLVLTRNPFLYENFQEELIKFDPEKYQPKDDRGQPIDRLKESKRYSTVRTKNTQKDYEFNTFAKFVTLISGREASEITTKTGKIKKIKAVKPMTDEEIVERYSHRVIIIDEAHNIRTTQSEDDEEEGGVSTEVYDQIHRFLHLVRGGKTLLMTATPIWNQPREIASLMNLILPLDEQLDYANFDKDHFTEDGRLKNREVLRKAFYGRVSYVRQMQSEVIRDYQGVKLEGGKARGAGLKIYPSEMSKFQYEIEKKAGERAPEEKAKRGAFNIDEMNAANFIFPDGTYRREGFERHIEPVPESSKGEKRATETRYRFKSSVDVKDLQKNLKTYSAKFADTIDEITSHPKENSFVFFKYIKGSNAILFGLLLELYGYKRVLRATSSLFSKPEKRYIIISGETISAGDLIKAFNDPRNAHGDYIQVIIGTRKMAEGVTLKNVLQTHIMMPHWHTAFIDQAIGRSIRFGSHTDLGLETVRVRIYLHASLYKNRETIDRRLYLLAEEKDYRGAQIYREVKRSAFDCPLAYARNVHPTDQANTRDCEYQDDCNYRCLQFPVELINEEGAVYEYALAEGDLDTSTYALYYRKDAQKRITSMVRRLFKIRDVVTFEEMAEAVPEGDLPVLFFSLEDLIDNRTPLTGRFGFQSFLQEKDNEYYLSERSRGVSTDESSMMIRDDINLSDIVEVFRLDEEKSDVLKLCDLEDEDEISDKIRELNYRTRVVLLEAAFAAGKVGNAPKIIKILRKMNMTVFEIDNHELITRTFEKFRKDMTKYRNLPSYIDKLWEFCLTYVSMDRIEELFRDLRIYVETRREAGSVQKIRKIIDKIEKIVMKSQKSEVTHVHALFVIEPQQTQYKRTLHVTGLIRCYDPSSKRWQFCPKAREVEYIQYIKDVETVGKKIATEDNPYGIYGTVDPLHDNIFRIVEKGNNGFVCAQMSDKPRLIRIIVSLRDKERELEGETTLKPQIADASKTMSKSQLVKVIMSYEQRGLEPLKKTLSERSKEDLREIEALTLSDLRGTLCPLIHRWFESKGLIVRV